MKKNYAFLSQLFSSNCSLIINDVASLCQDKEKKANPMWLVAFLLLLTMSSGQMAIAQNIPNRIFSSKPIFINYILLSAVAEGRSGGGGHGASDWVFKESLKNDSIKTYCQKL